MKDFLGDLAASTLSLWVQQSSSYPLLLVVHAVGLALLVGMLSMIDLCILGWVPCGIPARALHTLMRIGWTGLSLAALSGILLFLADGSRYYYSLTFRFKLASVILGVCLACALRGRILSRDGHTSEVLHGSTQTRMLAVLSLLCWLSAVTAGRLMAYID